MKNRIFKYIAVAGLSDGTVATTTLDTPVKDDNFVKTMNREILTDLKESGYSRKDINYLEIKTVLIDKEPTEMEQHVRSQF